MLFVKICGITNPQDARAAAAAGANAIGLNFVGGPRRLPLFMARKILRACPPPCLPVALVHLEDGRIAADLHETLVGGGVKHLQLYGRVTPEGLDRLAAEGFQTILVAKVTGRRFAVEVSATLCGLGHPPAILLLDAHVAGRDGGTGTVADWGAITAAREEGLMDGWPPLMLAGGLNADNVAEAVATVRPWAVDVSSGVESLVGHKDPAKLADFVVAARGA